MPPDLVRKIEKITLKTLPVYLLAVLLIVTAKPRPALFGVGLFVVLAGEALRIWATGHLRKNQEVTTAGPYAHLKHPLYAGTFLIMVGFCLMASQFVILIVGMGVFLFYYAPYKRQREAGQLARRFGQTWQDYAAQVPDYWPRWTPYSGRGRGRWNPRLVLKNSEHQTLLMVTLGTVLIGMRGLI